MTKDQEEEEYNRQGGYSHSSLLVIKVITHFSSPSSNNYNFQTTSISCRHI